MIGMIERVLSLKMKDIGCLCLHMGRVERSAMKMTNNSIHTPNINIGSSLYSYFVHVVSKTYACT